MSTASCSVRTRGLSKSFGETRACHEMSLEVHPGEVVALLGRSGSGKSTFLRHLNGLVRPDAGEIEVLGHDVTSVRGRDLRRMRRDIGMVFQHFNLIGRLTVMENVLTGALGRYRGPRYGVLPWPAAARREALAHLDRVGLADRAFQRADTLSGGQQQRVAIARMLMQQPRLVLADEPVSSLDPETAEQVMDLLVRICAEDDLTVICTLHQIPLALQWTQRVVALAEGHIVLDRPTSQLDEEQLRAVYAPVVTVPAPARAGAVGAVAAVGSHP